MRWMPSVLVWGAVFVCAAHLSAGELLLDPYPDGRSIDMTNYGIGQGGLSSRPMIVPYVEQLKPLRPQVIRLFVMEFYDLLPSRDRYNWEKLDRELEAIVATGATPLPALCMKPAVLFPLLDEKVVHPARYEDWDRFIEQLVRHVNVERKFGVKYWEVGNEVDIGERGGCPYLFDPAGYVEYYTHTVNAILRGDPSAKVGGPALGYHDDPIGDALLAHAAAGKAPLHFFSFHTYSNDLSVFRKRIRDVRARIAAYPQLREVETNLDEWNMSLGEPVADPAYQPAFVLAVSRLMLDEGLTRAQYYQISDYFLNADDFVRILSAPRLRTTLRQWNDMPIYLGLFDQHGRLRPTYHAFRLLAQIRGQRWRVSGIDAGLGGLAAENENGLQILLWNFGEQGRPEAVETTLRLTTPFGRKYQLLRLNPHACVNNLEWVRGGSAADLHEGGLELAVEPYGIRWLAIED